MSANGPPSNNPVPLEKTLVHMDLSKGLNERDRPETSDHTTLLTRVENLDQNQGGAWLKRAGSTNLGALSNGFAYTPARVLRLRDGLGMVDGNSNFYQYQESIGKFVQRGTVPEFSVQSDQIVSSGASVLPVIYSSGSSSLFHFVLHNAGLNVNATINSVILSVYDRQSGSTVAQYDLSKVGASAGPVQSPAAVFVDNRYIHVSYATGVAAVGCLGFVIDTQAVIIDQGLVSPVTLLAGSGTLVKDMEPGVGRSFIATQSAAGVMTVCYMTNAGTVVSVASPSAAAAPPVFRLAYNFNNGRLWWISTGTVGALNGTTLAVVVAEASHTVSLTGVTLFTIGVSAADNLRMATETPRTFGGINVTTVKLYKATAAGGTTLGLESTLDGWRIGSAPFDVNAVGYVNLYKESSYSLVPTVVVPTDSAQHGEPTIGPGTYNSCRLSATVEPFLAIRNGSPNGFIKIAATDSTLPTEFSIGVAVQTNARGYSYSVYALNTRTNFACQTFAGVNYFSGGVHCAFGGGDQVVEVGFLDIPRLNAVVSAVAGVTNGAYKYVLQYRYTDETGAVTWSRTSPVEPASPALLQVNMTASAPSVSSKDQRFGLGAQTSARISLEMYRTKAGGTQYYLCASSSAGTPFSGLATQVLVLGSGRLYTVTDNMSDTVLASQPLLFRQPGTPNSGLDRYPPPAGNVLCQHRDRLFTVDASGTRVCYSSFFVDGETAWYNPAFSFFVHGGSGRITAMTSMDGRLFIFKRDGIWVVDGDGPGEGGVIGNEFSPPQRLASEYGCVDHRSVVVTPDGIMYRSLRGIEQIDRGLRVKWLGERVFVTANNYPSTLASFVDTYGRVHFVCAQSFAATPALQANVLGVELVYDMTCDSWSAYYTASGACLKDGVMANLYQKGEVSCYAGAISCTYSNYSSGLDSDGTYTNYVKTTLETGWIRTGQQARQRISEAFLLAKKLSNHAIRISAAYDFVDTYTQTFTWQPDTLNTLSIEQLCLQILKPQTLALRLLVEEIAATDQVAYPSGAALGCAILGLTFNVAPMSGPPQVSAIAQGYVAPVVLLNLTTELLVILETELSATLTTEG